MDIFDELEKAKARVKELEAQIEFGPCHEFGHKWTVSGWASAGCGDDCACSVPVLECTKCGDGDYGDNKMAITVRGDCRNGENLQGWA